MALAELAPEELAFAQAIAFPEPEPLILPDPQATYAQPAEPAAEAVTLGMALSAAAPEAEHLTLGIAVAEPDPEQ